MLRYNSKEYSHNYLKTFGSLWQHYRDKPAAAIGITASSKFKQKQTVTPIQDGLFWSCSWMGGKKVPLLPKICNTYPIMMKLGTAITYLKKIETISESRDTSLVFCWHQYFFTGNQQILLYQEIKIWIALGYIISNSFNFSWVFKKTVLVNMATILMMSAKKTTPGLVKVKVFWSKDFDIIIFVHDVTKIFLLRDSIHIIMTYCYRSCDQSFVTQAFLWEKLSKPTSYKNLTRKTAFLAGWSWFKMLNRYWLYKKNSEIMMSLKYFSNFLRNLEMPLIHCGINLIPTISATFTVTDTKLYVPVVPFSTQDKAKLLQ